MAGIGQLLKRAVTGPSSAAVAKQAIPGAAINAGLGLLTGGPVEALAYGAGDFLVNYPALRAARKFFPGSQQVITDVATGKKTQSYAPSAVENAVNLVASLGAGAAVNAVLTPRSPQTQVDAQQFLASQAQQVNPAIQQQSQQNAQQLLQRSYVNQLPLNQLNLSPNTMYQMQGIEQTASNFHYPGITLPPELLEQLEELRMG